LADWRKHVEWHITSEGNIVADAMLSGALLNQMTTEWSLAEPYQVRPLAPGSNNVVYVVETPLGGYVLRIYSNHANPERLRFEHSVLAHLSAAQLPFAVPLPIPTRAGDSYARLPHGTGESLATLAPLLPGAHPDPDNLAQARAGGAALGILDVALASFPWAAVDAAVSWRSYGDLAHCHPLVPDPRGAIVNLPIASGARDRLARSYDALVERIPSLYAGLPQQLAHEDFAPDNLLFEGASVSGVLDFEFCARDLRVMDLTVALSWWPLARFGTGDEWPILRAVAEGYGRHITLTEEEAGAQLI
jgi:homoserine kinase type II